MNLSLLFQYKAIQILRHLAGSSDGFSSDAANRTGVSPVMAKRFAHDGVPVFSSAALANRSQNYPKADSKVSQRPARRPLRVSRVIEKSEGRASVGRMVISGSMADVCAELDRLVARESALH